MNFLDKIKYSKNELVFFQGKDEELYGAVQHVNPGSYTIHIPPKVMKGLAFSDPIQRVDEPELRANRPILFLKNDSEGNWAIENKEGEYHFPFGPAVENFDGSMEWWVDDENLTEEEFNERVIHEFDEGKCVSYMNEEGDYHREDGPAREWECGYKEWWLNGQSHREDGPAVIDEDGNKWWYQNNEHHREDGPAVEWAEGYKEWHMNGQLHREGGPAVEDTDGYKAWYQNGKRHREDGPAIIDEDGDEAWYIEDEELTEEEFDERVNGGGTKSYDVVNSTRSVV